MRRSRACPESPKAEFHRYLQAASDAMLWKLDGLAEYDVRRPMVPTGTNLVESVGLGTSTRQDR